MQKALKSIIKYLLLSVFTTVVYGLLNYFTGKEVHLQQLVLHAVLLFVCFCLLAFVAPRLRK